MIDARLWIFLLIIVATVPINSVFNIITVRYCRSDAVTTDHSPMPHIANSHCTYCNHHRILPFKTTFVLVQQITYPCCLLLLYNNQPSQHIYWAACAGEHPLPVSESTARLTKPAVQRLYYQRLWFPLLFLAFCLCRWDQIREERQLLPGGWHGLWVVWLLKPASVVMVGRLHPRSGLIFLCSCAPFNAKTNCLVSEAVEEGCYLFCCYNSLDSLVNVWLLFIR
jgi:hypothetical protein